MSEINSHEPRVPQFYKGQSIFITGSTGFMGKVLVERLLSTCPDIGTLYLLMRYKNEQCPEKRLAQLKQSQVFEVLRQRSPQQLDKLVAVGGDVTQPDFGMTAESIARLKEVSIVFHSAATVKFNECLHRAVEQNLAPVLTLLDVCDRLPHVQALIHVSTAYSNAELRRVEERVYPPPAQLDQLLRLVRTSARLGEQRTAQYVAPKPNTYTFTKAMAEHVLQQRRTRYSIAIFRPTIVVSTLRHPFPGWLENFNGPTGVVAGAGTGLLRVSLTRADARADLVPADLAIDTLICVAWETAMDKCSQVRVYNCTSDEHPVTWGQFLDIMNPILAKYPLSNAMWYPHLTLVTNRFIYKSLELLTQTLPLHLIEYMKQMFWEKSRHSLIKTNQKLQAMNEAISYFSLREWRFDNGNVQRLRLRLSPADRNLYNLDPRSIDWEEHITNFVKGTRRYVLQEKDEDIPAARARMKKLRALHIGSKLLLTLLFLRYLLQNKYFTNLLYRIITFLVITLKSNFTSLRLGFSRNTVSC